MARSAAFRKLAQLIRVAEECDKQGLGSEEGLALARDRKLWAPSRRALFTGAGASAAVLALGHSTPARASQPAVAVVGAGLAGLSCLETLAAKRIFATAYEASDRVGGRVRSMGGAFAGPVAFPGQVVERGGELIDTTHKMMRGWANQFGAELEPAEDGYDTLFYFDGQLYDEADVVDQYRDLVDAMRDDLRNVGSPLAGATTAAEEELDQTSLADYLDSRGAGSLVRAMIEAAYVGEYGLEIDEQTSLAFLLFIHADRRSKWRPFGVFSDERFHVKGGDELIISGLENRYQDQIELGHQLVAVTETSSGRIQLTFSTAGGTVEETVDRAVLALPFSVLREVDLSGSGLPAWKTTVIDNLRYGTNSKHMIGFNGRPWRSEGGSGAIYASGLATVSVAWQSNQSNATDTRAVLTNYSGGSYGAGLDANAVQAETRAVLADLEAIVAGTTAAASTSAGAYVAHIENWTTNPLSRGSYCANALGYFTDIADLEGVACGALHFAGEHTSSFYEWQGFMEGAALSGDRAALEVWRGSR